MRLHLIIAGLFLTLAPASAQDHIHVLDAHGKPFPSHCCNKSDYHKVPCEEINMIEKGGASYLEPEGHALKKFTSKQVYSSPDQFCHAFYYPYENGTAYCIFIQNNF